jgi:hypothetical protein
VRRGVRWWFGRRISRRQERSGPALGARQTWRQARRVARVVIGLGAIRRRSVSTRSAQRVEHLADAVRIGDGGSNGEPAAAAHANAKVVLEGSLERCPPIQPGARGVKLALENSVPMNEGQDVRSDVLRGARRGERGGRDAGGERYKGKPALARVARRRRLPRRRRDWFAPRGPGTSRCTSARRHGTEDAERCGLANDGAGQRAVESFGLTLRVDEVYRASSIA